MNFFESINEILNEKIEGKKTLSCEATFKGGDNIISCGDNIDFFTSTNMENSIKLIYMDPPFYSKAKYLANVKTRKTALSDKEENFKILAYSDIWNNDINEYLKMLTKRLKLSRELLKEDGFLWIHLDWHVVHYVKVILDEIFGNENFINEIIWQYKSGGASKNRFARKHDTILVYGKSENSKLIIPLEKSYNRGLRPYRFKGVEEFEDDIGWYTLVNMKDVWDIDMVGRTSKERTGYATQKPRELMKRIIKSSSKKGDLCCDFFAGSGSFPKACEELNRKWISCDINSLAAGIFEKEMLSKSFKVYGLKENTCDFKFSVQNSMLKIEKYNLDVNSISLDKDESEKLLDILKRDSLSLVSHFSVDTNYDYIIHKGEIVAKDIDRHINLSKKSAFQIRLVDIFGNVTLKEGRNE